MSKQRFFGILIIALLTGCSKSIYHVKFVDRKPCATESDTLTLIVKNIGLIGLSNVSLEAEGGFVDLGGIEPKSESCPIAIPPIYERPYYKIYVLETSGKGISFQTQPIDHIGDKVLLTGNHTLTIEVTKGTDGLQLKTCEIKK